MVVAMHAGSLTPLLHLHNETTQFSPIHTLKTTLYLSYCMGYYNNIGRGWKIVCEHVCLCV